MPINDMCSGIRRSYLGFFVIIPKMFRQKIFRSEMYIRANDWMNLIVLNETLWQHFFIAHDD